MNKLYVGNLSPSVTVEDLKQLFGERKLPVADQVLLKSGYAFVDFPDQNWAIKAIETLSGECICSTKDKKKTSCVLSSLQVCSPLSNNWKRNIK